MRCSSAVHLFINLLRCYCSLFSLLLVWNNKLTKLSFSCETVGRSFFSPNVGTEGDLGEGVEYWKGFYQSLRPTQMGLSLNIGTILISFIFKTIVSWITLVNPFI